MNARLNIGPIGFLQFVGVAETHRQAVELYKEPAEYFYGRCLHIDPRFASPPGWPIRTFSAAAAPARRKPMSLPTARKRTPRLASATARSPRGP